MGLSLAAAMWASAAILAILTGVAWRRFNHRVPVTATSTASRGEPLVTERDHAVAHFEIRADSYIVPEEFSRRATAGGRERRGVRRRMTHEPPA